MTPAEKGYLLIADITGYTQYLSESELDHARKVLKALLELLIDHTRPPLVISRLAGDAVISYALQEHMLQSQTYVEIIEDIYVAFRRAIHLMVLNTTCTCNACVNIPNLDLKFFVHFGSFGIDRLGQHSELVGSEVNLLHRLLKNKVTETTGFQAYSLYTDAAIQQLGLQGFEERLVSHQETYEHLGEVVVWIQDMQPVWEMKKDQLRLEVPLEEALAYAEEKFKLPPHVMWDLVTDPDYRNLFVQSDRQEVTNRQGGRLGLGSVYQCYHGDDSVSTQTIVEWRPFEQMTVENSTPVPGATVLFNVRLTPTGAGTLVTLASSKARGPWLNRVLCDLLGRLVLPTSIRNGMREFQAQVEKEMAEGNFSIPESAVIQDEQIGQAAAASLKSE